MAALVGDAAHFIAGAAAKPNLSSYHRIPMRIDDRAPYLRHLIGAQPIWRQHQRSNR
jgi:hypothetical protein